VVPFFKRSYVWEEKNWEVFWENICQVCRARHSGNTGSYFIGTVIVKLSLNGTANPSRYDLIDGQQRLITASIIFRALADSCGGQDGRGRLPEMIRDVLMFRDKNGRDLLKIAPGRNDRDYFRTVMTGQGEEDLNNQRRLMLRCYNYFAERIRPLNDEEKGELFNILMHQVSFISVDLSADDDERVILGTIHSLGTRPAIEEMLKNEIFQAPELQASYEKYWKSTFEDQEEQIIFWNAKNTHVENGRTNMENLLHCYLVIKTQNHIPMEELLEEYQYWLKQKSIDEQTAFLKKLKTYAAIYRSFPYGQALNTIAFTEIEKRFFRVVEKCSLDSIYPLILFLYQAAEDRGQVYRMLELLESYLVRRNICGLTTDNYSQLFVSMIQEFQNGERAVTFTELADLLQSYYEDADRFPRNREFRDGILVNMPSRQEAGEFLYSLALYQERDAGKLSFDDFFVEYMMPRRWDMDLPQDEITGEQIRRLDRALRTMGNLTLVTEEIGEGMEIGSWQMRKHALNEKSPLCLTRNYLECEYWTENEICSRGSHLADDAVKIWPQDDLYASRRRRFWKFMGSYMEDA